MRVFRTIESKAHAQQEELRSEVDKTKRVSKSGQQELFGPAVLASSYDSNLARRYQRKAREEVKESLRQLRRVLYDTAEEIALAFPLTSPSTLKSWIREWVDNGSLTVEGLAERERVPKRNCNHVLVWH